MSKVVTPLKLQAWQALRHYPDEMFAGYRLCGIQMGFRIGFDTRLITLKLKRGNLTSALEQPSIEENYLHKEMQADRVIKLHPSESIYVAWYPMQPCWGDPKVK